MHVHTKSPFNIHYTRPNKPPLLRDISRMDFFYLSFKEETLLVQDQNIHDD